MRKWKKVLNSKHFLELSGAFWSSAEPKCWEKHSEIFLEFSGIFLNKIFFFQEIFPRIFRIIKKFLELSEHFLFFFPSSKNFWKIKFSEKNFFFWFLKFFQKFLKLLKICFINSWSIFSFFQAFRKNFFKMNFQKKKLFFSNFFRHRKIAPDVSKISAYFLMESDISCVIFFLKQF